MQSKEYYDYAPILSRNGIFNIVVGPRGNGKSYGAKKFMTKKALTEGKQFIYLRRHKEDLKYTRDTFFNDIAKEFPKWNFRVNGNLYQASKNKKNWQTIGLAMSLSTAQQFKSASHPDVHYVLYDEFIIEDGYVQYLKDEVNTLTGFVVTLDRYQDRVKVFMLANSVRIDNPYFVEWNILPNKDGFVTRKDGAVVAHFPSSSSFVEAIKKSRLGKFIVGSSYESYAMGNEFRDNGDELIMPKTSRATYMYTLVFKRGMISVWRDAFEQRWFISKKHPRERRYFTMHHDMVSEECYLLERGSENLRGLRKAFAGGMLYFDGPPSRNIFLEVFKR